MFHHTVSGRLHSIEDPCESQAIRNFVYRIRAVGYIPDVDLEVWCASSAELDARVHLSHESRRIVRDDVGTDPLVRS